MTRVLVLQGPNLNLLGHARARDLRPRRPSTRSTPRSRARADELGLDVDFFQSNHEGALIDRLHAARLRRRDRQRRRPDPHPVALRDALLAVERPFIEVHLSDPATREPFRQVNFLPTSPSSRSSARAPRATSWRSSRSPAGGRRRAAGG